jgi:hypothetical protein
VRPEQPTYHLEPLEHLGFAIGDYWACISVVGPGGSHTETSTPVRFSVLDSGKYIEFALPPEMPEFGERYGLWLSRVDGDWDTIRLQAIVTPSGGPAILRGPYNSRGRKRPEKNETMIGNPKKPSWGKPRKNDLWRQHALHDLQAPMRIAVSIVETSVAGDSLPSAPSDSRTFRGRRRRVRERSSETGETTGQEKEIQREPIRNEGVYVRPDAHHREAIGYKVYCQVDDIANPPWYRLIKTRSEDKTEAFVFDKKRGNDGNEDDRDRRRRRRRRRRRQGRRGGGEGGEKGIAPVIYGYKDEGDTTGGGNLPRHLRWILIPEDPPTEDSSGIEGITGEIDPPRPVGPTRPTPGQYWLTYTRRINGLQSRHAPPVRVTVPGSGGVATHIPVMHFPPRVQKIQNAMFSSLNVNDKPRLWDLDQTGGVIDVPAARPGTVRISTNAPIVGTGMHPFLRHTNFVQIDGERLETLRGTLFGDSITSGKGVFGLVQYDQAGVLVVPGDERASTLVVHEIALNGAETTFKKTVAGQGITADLNFHPEAAWAKPKLYADGNGRSLTFSAWNLAWHPFDGEPRKLDLTPVGLLAPAEESDDPSVPYPSGHVFAITKPAAPQGTSASYPAPLYRWDLNSGLPPQMTINRNVVNANTQVELLAVANLSGTGSGLRVRNDHRTSFAHNFVTVDMRSLWGTRGGVKWNFRLTRSFTHIGSRGRVFCMIAETGEVVAEIVVANTTSQAAGALRRSTVQLITHQQGRNVPPITRTLETGLLDNTLLEMEVVAGFGGGNDSATVYWSVGGASRRGTTIFAGDFAGRAPGYFQLGVSSYSDKRARYTFDYDDIVVTERGDAPTATLSVPLVPLPQPVWPMRTGTEIHSGAGTINHAVTDHASRDTLGLEYRFTPTTTASTATRIAWIEDSGGTGRAELWEAADGHVELRGPGIQTTRIEMPRPNGTERRVELLASGFGTISGTVGVYRTAPGVDQERELMEVQEDLNWSAVTPARARTATRSGLTANSSIVTDRGTLEPIDTHYDGTPIHQGYAWINRLDAIVDEDVGQEFDEEFVTPGVEHTWALRLKLSNMEEGCKPFNVVLYDREGTRRVAAQLLGAEGSATGDSPWSDYAVFFTPAPGEYRCRIENDDMFGGDLRWQQPLLCEGRHETDAERDAERAKRRAVKGEMRLTLRGFVPLGSMETSPYRQDYGEEWLRLLAYGDTPEGTALDMSGTASNDTISAPGHRYRNGGTVRFRAQDILGGSVTLPTPLAEDTTYFVRDANETTGTFKLSATDGGVVLNITGNGAGSVYGFTSVDAVYRSTNQEPPAAWESEWLADPADVPQDRRYADVYVTMRSSGEDELFPTITPGQVELVYKTFQPTLLRADRTPYTGGTVVGGLTRDWVGAELDTDPVNGLPRRRRMGDPIRKIENTIEVDFHDPDAFVEFMEAYNEGETFVVEHPAANAVMLIDPYELGDPEYEETELFEETTGWLKVTIPINRAHVLESHTLIPLEEFDDFTALDEILAELEQ